MKLPRHPLFAVLYLLSLLALSGCVSSSYMGIALGPGAADPDLQQLAQRARSGDKQAQLELGNAFEEGLGVTPSRSRAITLYRQAAKDNSGTGWVYVPSPGGGVPSGVLKIGRSNSSGLIESRTRLERLNEKN